jgi:hypothetical protein
MNLLCILLDIVKYYRNLRYNYNNVGTASVRSLSEYMCSMFQCFKIDTTYCDILYLARPPLWSNGQSSRLLIQGYWVRFPALANFLRSSGSGMGYTQPREDK